MIPYVFKYLTALHYNMKLLCLEFESTYSTSLLPEYFFLRYYYVVYMKIYVGFMHENINYVLYYITKYQLSLILIKHSNFQSFNDLFNRH